MTRNHPAAPDRPRDGIESIGTPSGDARAPAPVRHVPLDGGGEFRIEQDGRSVAEATYTIDSDGAMVIRHTHVSDELRGQGVALRLTRAAVDHARRGGMQVVPVCSYARKTIARHEDLQDVLKS